MGWSNVNDATLVESCDQENDKMCSLHFVIIWFSAECFFEIRCFSPRCAFHFLNKGKSIFFVLQHCIHAYRTFCRQYLGALAAAQLLFIYNTNFARDLLLSHYCRPLNLLYCLIVFHALSGVHCGCVYISN